MNICIPTTFPPSPPGSRSELSFTSLDLSPKIALRSLSSAVNSVSPFGVILPASISPSRTVAPILTIPSSSRSFSFASPTFGMSMLQLQVLILFHERLMYNFQYVLSRKPLY